MQASDQVKRIDIASVHLGKVDLFRFESRTAVAAPHNGFQKGKKSFGVFTWWDGTDFVLSSAVSMYMKATDKIDTHPI